MEPSHNGSRKEEIAMKTQICPSDRRGAAGLASQVERFRKGGSIVPLITVVILCATGLVPLARADPFAPVSFPLNVGDKWTYVAERGQRADVRVSETFEYGDWTVYRTQGYLFGFSTADVLFFDDQGNTAELSPDSHQEQMPRPSGIWYPWTDHESRVEIPAFAPDCIHGTSGNFIPGGSGGDVVVPAGHFMNAVTINYDTHPCADQDLVSESFVPGIGLVARTVRTFVGEQRWELASATIDGQLIGPAGGPGSETRQSEGGAPDAGTSPATWGSVKAVFAQ
jgi:hypothetical protein